MRCAEPSQSRRFSRRNLYIFSSRFGGLWCVSAVVIYLMGIQASSSTPLLLAYLMGGLMLLALFLTHQNLAGLELRSLEQPIAFAGERGSIALEARSQQWHSSLLMRWRGRPEAGSTEWHLGPGVTRLELPWLAAGRGRQRPGELLLLTRAPLGLFRCWSRWTPDLLVTVAPARRPGPVQWLEAAAGPSQASPHTVPQRQAGGDSFQELRPWRPEEGAQRLDWKARARGRGDLCKTFSDDQLPALWCSPDPHLPLERGLEHVCDQLCRMAAAGQVFGLMLPDGSRIAPGSGASHLERCLSALALAPAETP
jgi:uncharacterized protein (DUF58 family)